ncbi:MAG TPA: zinc metallopeptidase [bacterium]|nr:zinc metallopeptidase [bacterium]
MFYFDPLYFLFIAPAFLLALYAQFRVKSAFSRYSRVGTMSGITGAAAARRILDSNGLHDVAIEAARGWLSDHYDPRSRVLRLSPEVYATPSVAAAGIAAHEAGHALQHAAGYAPLKIRNAIVPTASIGSWLAFPMILIGALMSAKGLALGGDLALAGFLLFSAFVVFQLFTLPVELDASRRAKKVIADLGIIRTQEEAAGVSTVLNAAALTYVAATLSALAQLLYFALRLGLIGGRRS